MRERARTWLVIIFGIALLIGIAQPVRSGVEQRLAQEAPQYLPLVVVGSRHPGETATPVPVTETVTATPTIVTQTTTATTPTTSPPTATIRPATDVLERFEDAEEEWRIFRDASGDGASIRRTTSVAADGRYAARLFTTNNGSAAMVRVNFVDSATSHEWEERPGTWYWQRASVYLPSSTVAQLSGNAYLTLAALWPRSGGPYGWNLRVRQGGQLYVYGYTADAKPVEFTVHDSFPLNAWTELELGLHTQGGPGVKRAFAFLVNGEMYGWYRQGNMGSETYDRAAIGIVDTNSSQDLVVYIDGWGRAGTGRFPTGRDNRPEGALTRHDFRTERGAHVQYDWSTWAYQPTLHPRYGLFSRDYRVQAGVSLDRMPSLVSGWAEIEIDWPNGTPNIAPVGYFGPMVGFRKEINREENLEVIPIGKGRGLVNLALEAWIGNPIILAEWPLPKASIGDSHLPEPGDVIRVRWEQMDSGDLDVQVSYYDASAAVWHVHIIDRVFNLSNVSDSDESTDNVNFADGFHTASSITIDSPQYSIRRYTVGTLTTYP